MYSSTDDVDFRLLEDWANLEQCLTICPVLQQQAHRPWAAPPSSCVQSCLALHHIPNPFSFGSFGEAIDIETINAMSSKPSVEQRHASGQRARQHLWNVAVL